MADMPVDKFVRSLSSQVKLATAQTFFDKVIRDNTKAIDKLVQHGDATGQPYVLLMFQDGKGHCRLNGMNAVDCSQEAERWESVAKVAWIELQKAAKAANPANIPLLICSELFEMATWRLLQRTTTGLESKAQHAYTRSEP